MIPDASAPPLRLRAKPAVEALENRLPAGNLLDLSLTGLLLSDAFDFGGQSLGPSTVTAVPPTTPAPLSTGNATALAFIGNPAGPAKPETSRSQGAHAAADPLESKSVTENDGFQDAADLFHMFVAGGSGRASGSSPLPDSGIAHAAGGDGMNAAPGAPFAAGTAATGRTAAGATAVDALTAAASVVSAAAPSKVYVNSAWAGVAAGADPDGTGPATALGYDAFVSVQQAVNAVAAGGTVDVAPGTHSNEALRITKDVTLQDPGGQATVQAPNIFTDPVITDPYGQKDILFVVGGATVTMDGITVQGPGPGPYDSIDYGIFVGENATLNLSNSTVSDIHDDPLSGDQNGVGIGVGRDSKGAVGHATLTNDVVTASQKCGIVVDGAGSDATIDSCTVTGVGPTPLIAENGIQVSRGAVGTVTNCTVSGHSYTGTYGGRDLLTATQSCGILLYQAGAGTAVSGNAVSQNDVGIYSQAQGAVSVSGNTVTNNYDEGIFVDQSATEASGNTVSGSPIGFAVGAFYGNTADSSATLTSNTITANGTGVALLNDTPGDGVVPMLNATFNYIVGNGVGVDNTQTFDGVAVANNNWWGSNAGPNGTGSDTTRGPVTAGVWQVLTVDVSLPVTTPGSSLTVTANLQTDSAGGTAVANFVPDGIAAHFAVSSGSIDPGDTGTVTGLAHAVYTAPDTGPATVSVTVDNQTVNSAVQISPLVAVDDTYTVAENTPLQVQAADGLLANDFASSGIQFEVANPHSYTRTLHDTLRVMANGAFTYQPDPSYLGPDSFTYYIRQTNGPAISPPAQVNFLVEAAPPTPKGAVKGPNIVPGFATYTYDVTFDAVDEKKVTDVSWTVTDKSMVAHKGEAFLIPDKKDNTKAVGLSLPISFDNDPGVVGLQVHYSIAGKPYVARSLDVNVVQVKVTTPKDAFTASKFGPTDNGTGKIAFKIDVDGKTEEKELIGKVMAATDLKMKKDFPGLAVKAIVQLSKAPQSPDTVYKAITVGFIQQVRPAAFSVDFPNVKNSLVNTDQSPKFFLDSLSEKAPWSRPSTTLKGSDGKSHELTERDTPSAAFPLEWPFKPGDKASQLNYHLDFQLDIAAETSASPGDFWIEAHAAPKEQPKGKDNKRVSWVFDGSGKITPQENDKFKWDPIKDMTGLVPPATWNEGSILNPALQIPDQRIQDVTEKSVWKPKA